MGTRPNNSAAALDEHSPLELGCTGRTPRPDPQPRRPRDAPGPMFDATYCQSPWRPVRLSFLTGKVLRAHWRHGSNAEPVPSGETASCAVLGWHGYRTAPPSARCTSWAMTSLGLSSIGRTAISSATRTRPTPERGAPHTMLPVAPPNPRGAVAGKPSSQDSGWSFLERARGAAALLPGPSYNQPPFSAVCPRSGSGKSTI